MYNNKISRIKNRCKRWSGIRTTAIEVYLLQFFGSCLIKQISVSTVWSYRFILREIPNRKYITYSYIPFCLFLELSFKFVVTVHAEWTLSQLTNKQLLTNVCYLSQPPLILIIQKKVFHSVQVHLVQSLFSMYMICNKKMQIHSRIGCPNPLMVAKVNYKIC